MVIIIVMLLNIRKILKLFKVFDHEFLMKMNIFS